MQRTGQLNLRIFDDADHVFTDLGLRRDMLAHLDQVMAAITTGAVAQTSAYACAADGGAVELN